MTKDDWLMGILETTWRSGEIPSEYSEPSPIEGKKRWRYDTIKAELIKRVEGMKRHAYPGMTNTKKEVSIYNTALDDVIKMIRDNTTHV